MSTDPSRIPTVIFVRSLWPAPVQYALLTLILLAGGYLTERLLDSGQFQLVLWSFAVTLVLAIALMLVWSLGLRRLAAKFADYEVNLEFAERETLRIIELASRELPEAARKAFLAEMKPIIRVLSLYRAELAALGVRVTATEEELAAVRARLIQSQRPIA